jgi:glycosyltransferase involved in cell wall biosynthesis
VPGVEVVGFVEDLRSEYARCACTIGPTSWGGGTKIKIVESAAMGRACVATPHAIRGFEYLAQGPEPALIVARDAAQFTAGVIRLLGDPPGRRRMGDAGRVLAAMRSGLQDFCGVVSESLRRMEGALVAAPIRRR